MTATVSEISWALAGSIVIVLTRPLSVSTVLLVYGAPIGLRAGLVHHARLGMDAARRSQAVDYKVDGPEIPPDDFECPGLDFVRKGIPVQILRVKSGGPGGAGEPDGIVPARRGQAAFLGRPLEKDTDGGGAASESGGDPRCQAVPGGSPDNQNLFRSILDRPSGHGGVDPFTDVRGAAIGMGRHANEAAYAGLDDHGPEVPGEPDP